MPLRRRNTGAGKRDKSDDTKATEGDQEDGKPRNGLDKGNNSGKTENKERNQNKTDQDESDKESDESTSSKISSSESKKKQLYSRGDRLKQYRKAPKDTVMEDSDNEEEEKVTQPARSKPPPQSSRAKAKTDKMQRNAPPKPSSEFSEDEGDEIHKYRVPFEQLLSPWAILIGVLFVIVLAWVVTSFSLSIIRVPSYPVCIKRERSERLKVLQDELRSLPREYPSLDKSIWDVIAGASWGHIGNKIEPVKPVVLFLAGEHGKINASDVALDVADMYANVYTPRRSDSDITYVVGKAFEGKSPSKAKADMDAIIKKGLEGCSNVVLITDVEKIPACSAILFHAYCDSDNAPYKDAVIIFTMTLDGATSVAKGTDESIVESQLQKLWTKCPEEIPPEKMVAMFSRVTNNAVILK